MNKRKIGKNNRKNLTEIIKNSVPDDIKVLFGKFYVYSLLYVIFWGLLYPLVLVDRLHKLFSIFLILLLSALYGFIIYDIRKKTKGYSSNLFFFLIILVFLATSLSVIKLMF